MCSGLKLKANSHGSQGEICCFALGPGPRLQRYVMLSHPHETAARDVFVRRPASSFHFPIGRFKEPPFSLFFPARHSLFQNVNDISMMNLAVRQQSAGPT
jgi:hypothetical protein